MRAEPRAGKSDRTAIRAPQSTAALMPTMAKRIPPTSPCTSATTTVPLSVARETVTKCPNNRCARVFPEVGRAEWP